MTVLYLRTADTGWGAGRKQITGSRSATAAVTSVTNTAAITGGIGLTDTPGGTVLAWWFRVGQPVTLGGTFTARIRGFESNLLANAQFSIQLDACTVSTVLGAIMPLTMCTPTELTTTDAANSISTAVALSGITVNTGDFIRCTVRINAVGTMAAGYTVTMSYDGPTSGAAGDSFLNFSDTLINYPPAEVLQAQLPGPPTAAITGTAKNQGAWAASKIGSVLTSTIAATQLNQAATGGQIASVLTNQTTANQTNTGAVGGQIASVLTSAITGTVVAGGVLVAPVASVLTGSIVGTSTNPGVTSSKVASVLTGGAVGTLTNAGVLVANLPRTASNLNDLVIVRFAQAAVDDQGAANGTTQTATLTQQLTQGSVIIAALTVANGTANATITDDAGLVWNPIGTMAFFATTGLLQGLFWARNTTSKASLAVTVTYSVVAARRALQLHEVTGLDPTDATLVDAITPMNNTGSANTVASGSGAPTTPGDLLITFAVSSAVPTPTTPTGLVGDTGGTIASRNTNGAATVGYRVVTGAPVSYMIWTTAGNQATQIIGALFRPGGVHTPRFKAVSGTQPLTPGQWASLPSGWAPGDKAIIWLHLIWPNLGAADPSYVTVPGFTNAGWVFTQDATSGVALWAGWRDLQAGDSIFQVNVANLVGVTLEAVVELLAFDGGAPVGSPWGPGGISYGAGFYYGNGPGPTFLPLKTPQSSYVLNTVFGWTGQQPTNMSGSTPSTLYWQQRNSGQYGDLLYEAPSHDAGPVTPYFTPPGANPTIALWGQVENGAPAMQGSLAAKLPSLTGTLLEVQGIPGVLQARLPLATSTLTAAQAVVGTLQVQLPLARTTLTATQVNTGVLTAQVASVLTTAQTAAQANAGVLAANLPVLTGRVADQGTAVIVAQLPLLSGSLTATMVVAGVLTPKLPLLTNQTTAANINQAVLTGTLPHPLTTQTTLSQTNTGSTISFLPFPLLTSAITGAVVGQAGIAARLPLLTVSVVGLSAGAGTVNPSLPILTSTITVTQVNQGQVSGQVGSAVTTTGLTGTLLNQAVTTANLPLLTAFVSDAIPGTVAGIVPLLTAAMTGTLVTLSGDVSGNLPSLVGTLIGTPIIGGDLSTAVLPLLTTELTADFFIHGTVHVPLPLLRTHLRGDSIGAVYLDVTVSAAPTRQGGMRVGSGDTHTLTLAGAAGTRADTVAAGDMRVGLTAGATRAERGPR